MKGGWVEGRRERAVTAGNNKIFTFLFFCSCSSIPQPHIIKTKSTECMSFPLTLASLLVTSAWALYGHFIEDKLIMVSNTIRRYHL